MRAIILACVVIVFSQHAVGKEIDLERWSELPTVKHSCAKESIFYEETPAYGIRTILCHAISIWPIETLEMLSGEKVFISGPHGKKGLNLMSKNEFGHYNPEFINWAVINMIPDYNSVANQKILKGIYDGYLKPVFRASLKIHYDLIVSNEYRIAEVKKYRENPSGHNYYSYSKRWAMQNDDSHVNGSQIYSFWLRRYIDDSSFVIAKELERFLSFFDPEFLNATRTRFGLMKVKSNVLEKLQTDEDMDNVFVTLETMNEEEKIKYLKSIRYTFSDPAHVSRILIAIGDLKPRYKNYNYSQADKSIYDEYAEDGLFYNEINGGYIYYGKDYDEVIKLYPDTEYAEQAAYKKLSTYQGGECEGEVDCEIQVATRREIDFISQYPKSKYVIKILKDIEPEFERRINEIKSISGESDYYQSSLRHALKASLESLDQATRTSPDTIKAFVNYYSGLYYLKLVDLKSSKKFLDKNAEFTNISDNKYIQLSNQVLLLFPSNKVKLQTPGVLQNRFYTLNWEFNGIDESTVVDIYRKVGEKDFTLLKRVQGTTTKIPIDNINNNIKYKIGFELPDLKSKEWSNIVDLTYSPKITVVESYIRDGNMYVWLNSARGWSEIVKVDLSSQQITHDSVSFIGNSSCNEDTLNDHQFMSVIDRRSRDYILLPKLGGYQFRSYDASHDYELTNLSSCLKDETDKFRLSASIDKNNKTIWFYPFGAYTRSAELGSHWASVNYKIIKRPVNVKFSLKKDRTYYYDTVNLLKTPNHVISYSQKNGRASIFNLDGSQKNIKLLAYNNSHSRSPFQFSEETNSLFWFDTQKSISRLDLTTYEITTIKLSKAVQMYGGVLQVMYNNKTNSYWVIAGKGQNTSVDGKKYWETVLSFYIFDHQGEYVKDTPILDFIF